jgi:hypothetical protein
MKLNSAMFVFLISAIIGFLRVHIVANATHQSQISAAWKVPGRRGSINVNAAGLKAMLKTKTSADQRPYSVRG